MWKDSLRFVEPTMVMFMPICTDTGVPPTLTVVLPLRYQPSDPVENGEFGWSSAIAGGTLFNGAYNATVDDDVRQGAVYLNVPEP